MGMHSIFYVLIIKHSSKWFFSARLQLHVFFSWRAGSFNCLNISNACSATVSEGSSGCRVTFSLSDVGVYVSFCLAKALINFSKWPLQKMWQQRRRQQLLSDLRFVWGNSIPLFIIHAWIFKCPRVLGVTLQLSLLHALPRVTNY